MIGHRPCSSSRRRCRSGERGAALIIVIFAATLILLTLGTMLTFTRMSGRSFARQMTYQGQAVNAASAGITEGLSWFVRQGQPVLTFNPQLDPGGVCTHIPPHTPPVNDSDDPAVGIVRTYEIMRPGRVYGQYQVRRTAVSDVSRSRGKGQDGVVWQLDSTGFIYVNNAPGQPPTQAPNVVIARSTMRSEIQRLGLQPPANAALCVDGNANIGAVARVQGGSSGIGIAWSPSAGAPNVSGTVTGNPAINPTANSFTMNAVFGVSQQELISMADIVVNNVQTLPPNIPTMSVVVIRGNATFTPVRPLVGSGILVVLGNLTLNSQSNASYDGVIYVTGTFVASPPTNINGSVIVLGNTQLTGGSDVTEINYDASIIDQIRMQKGNYLFNRSPWLVSNN